MLETGDRATTTWCQVDDPAAATGYRFILDTLADAAGRRAREAVMDANPWTYQVMAKEMAARARSSPPPRRTRPRCPTSATTCGPRSTRTPPTRSRRRAAAGSAPRSQVKLRGRRALVRVQPRRARLVDPARRPGGDDDRAAAGHDAADVEAVKAVAVPVGAARRLPDRRDLAQPRVLPRCRLPAREPRSWAGAGARCSRPPAGGGDLAVSPGTLRAR